MKREMTYICSLQGLSLSPTILYSELEGFTFILKFLRVRLACQ